MATTGGEAGYLRYPTISGDTVVFVCDDDLWTVPVEGGRAWRLTAGVAAVAHPRLSPDGSRVAFVGSDEGPDEVYVLPMAGGPARRLTYDGARCVVATWQGDDIVYASTTGQAHQRAPWLHRIPAAGGVAHRLPYGTARAVSFGPGGGVVLGRNTDDPARWKRYRGGTAGVLWVDPTGSGEFDKLLTLAGNLASPCWVGDRIYFLSDHEGVGNVYSCTPDGSDLRRHSDHDDFYARHLSTDGVRLVYHCAADLYLLDPEAGEARRLPVHTGSSQTQRNRRFFSAADYLDTVAIGPDGTDLAITARGKAFSFPHWEGAVRQHGEPDGVRHRLLDWLSDHRRLVAVAADEGVEERLVVLTADGSQPPQMFEPVLDGVDLGRVVELAPSPHADEVALVNHRHEVLHVRLDPAAGAMPRARQVDHSRYGRPSGLAWAPDGRWFAYACAETPQTQAIKLCRVDSGDVWPVTRPVLRDHTPAFDPEGRYLYFIGQREFDPVYDSLQFELSFPLGSRPYAICLRDDVESPFVPKPRPLVSDAAASQRKVAEEEQVEQEAESDRPTPVEIDLDGIVDRAVVFPVPEGRYQQIAGVVGKALFSSVAVEGSGGASPFDTTPPAKAVIEAYDFETHKTERLVEGVTSFVLDRGHRTLLYRAGNRLRLVKAGEKPPEGPDEPGRASGWIDLDRVKVSVRPGAEWRQMFREAWRLQRDHFWAEDMSGVAWAELYDRYLPLVDRVATRAELSDLLWELQGELGTSHAYELGGEYRPGPHYRQGFLGVDWQYDEGSGRFEVGRIVAGDRWDPRRSSPLCRPGVDVRVGDVVVAVNGQPVGATDAGSVPTVPGAALVNQADQEVQLTVVRGAAEPRTVTVRALADEGAARYRDWVETNRATVHERTGGRVGYLHVPDMMGSGLAEFHRGFLAEHDRDALLVDVRFNSGGHVSALLLEKLARRRVGYDFPRWLEPQPHPEESPAGPIVALTNEHAGSDGDIFCHVFKLRGLGVLVGTRTWGGVVGISPQYALADGTITTQPEYSFAFDDVGWQVENYGTDPHVEVDITPQDYAAGADPQLDRAIAIALDQLAEHPPHRPAPRERPRLGVPPLPPRR